MRRTLLIVGASARAAAFSAARAGFQPLAFDCFADADLAAHHAVKQVAPYPSGLAKLVAAQPGKPLMYVGALENHPALVDQLAQGRPLYGNTGSVLQQVRDPFQLASVLGDRDLLFPEVRRNADDLPRDGSWLSKPLKSCGGTGIEAYDDKSEVASVGKSTYFQRRVEGQPCAAVFVAVHGNATLLGVTRQLIGATWTGASGFQYCGSIGPLTLPGTLLQQFRRLGNVLAGEFGLTGLFGVDVILDEQQVWCVEVNPRYTASVEVLECALGLRAIESHVQAFQEGLIPAEIQEPMKNSTKTVGKAILYARHDIGQKEPLWKSLLEENQLDLWPAMTDIPTAESSIPSQSPILTLWAKGANVAEVEKNLRKRSLEFSKQLAS